jgi:glutamate:Na+ symporter, ESS family
MRVPLSGEDSMTISDSLISLDILLSPARRLSLGAVLCQRVALLARYSIPSPIVGGVLFAIAATVLIRIAGQGIAMANTAKSDPFLLAQDALGVLMAKLLGLHPFLGLVAGSITLVGGHGTGAAYAEKFGEASAIPGVMALSMTSATLGLVLGGVIGGPVAERLIRRFSLSPLPVRAIQPHAVSAWHSKLQPV